MIPATSPLLCSLFTRYAQKYVARGIHAVRVSHSGLPPQVPPGRPLVVYLNHPSWWDPMIGLILAARFWSGRRHFAPIDEVALQKYRFLARLGFFGIAKQGTRGGALFLRTSVAILQQPNTALWITGEGDFCDPRVRPVALRPGLGHLSRRVPQAVFVPLALEYPFWQERIPEALCRFGTPLEPGAERATPSEWTARLQLAIQETQDALAVEAVRRRPGDFQTILVGKVGVGFFYDRWRAMKATRSGRCFDAAHGSEP
ncbi:lysophospholipid acyltransferase family protein [Singulisphaera sp. Ch08]|uniref:Lysophospholipid acyltransferase family protein n=1 Tax=Singulisphaera sp. Ch08 TaxID=3120278 RepID=A0AAU7C9N8_9BACT